MRATAAWSSTSRASAAAPSIKSTFRQSRAVEQLIDEWLAAHPEAPRLMHLEDAEHGSSGDAGHRRRAAESVGAADPGNPTPANSAAGA
jgi:hypothetical protein